MLGDTFATGPVGEFLFERCQIVLILRKLNVSEEFRAHPDQTRTAAKQIARGTHGFWVGVGLREHAASQENRNLLRVDAVVLGLPAVDGFHVERVAQNELDAFILAQVRGASTSKRRIRRQRRARLGMDQ